jgi:hypothetical protein
MPTAFLKAVKNELSTAYGSSIAALFFVCVFLAYESKKFFYKNETLA